jgi:hypothetical protein
VKKNSFFQTQKNGQAYTTQPILPSQHFKTTAKEHKIKEQKTEKENKSQKKQRRKGSIYWLFISIFLDVLYFSHEIVVVVVVVQEVYMI